MRRTTQGINLVRTTSRKAPKIKAHGLVRIILVTLYKMRNGNEKTVVYFLARYSDQTPAHNPGFEIREHLVLPLEEACAALTFENTKEILRDAEEYILNYKKLG